MLACVSKKPAQSAGWRCCCWFWWCIYSVLWLHFAAAARHAHIMRSGGMLRLPLPACLYCVYKRVVVVEALEPRHAVGSVCGIYYVMRTQARLRLVDDSFMWSRVAPHANMQTGSLSRLWLCMCAERSSMLLYVFVCMFWLALQRQATTILWRLWLYALRESIRMLMRQAQQIDAFHLHSLCVSHLPAFCAPLPTQSRRIKHIIRRLKLVTAPHQSLTERRA